MRVIWTPRAQRRLQQIFERIAEDQPANATRWIGKALSRGDQIANYPRSGRPVPEFRRDDIREIFEGDCRIIYRIRPDQIDVLTIRHGAKLLRNLRSL